MDAYAAATTDCALVDRSGLGKLALAGPDAKEFLNGQVSNDVEALEAGHGQYAALLTPKGKMLGDLRILDVGDELLLLTERVSLQALFDQVRRGLIGWRAMLDKRTLELGLLSLLGPRTDAIAEVELPSEEHASVRWRDGWAVRTDLGVDLLVAAAETDAVARELVERGAAPADEAVAEVVRVEHGRPRYGIDLDESVIPQEAGLNERAVSFTKGCYVGQETVARLHYKGRPNRILRGLEISSPVPSGTPLRTADRDVGRIGSSVVSPRLGPIALALVRREVEPGAALSADGATARVVELPFAGPGPPK